MLSSTNKIILFDGICNFCNFWINVILKRDSKKIFRFAPLQSEAGIMLANKYSIKKIDIDSVILIQEDSYFIKSTAALKIAKKLTFPMNLLYLLVFIPLPIRDFIYDLIAKRRYKIFGKRTSCRVPTKEEKSRFFQ